MAQTSHLARKSYKDPNNKKNIQSVAAHAILQQSCIRESLYQLLLRRTFPLGFGMSHHISRADVDSAISCAKASPAHDALAWLKTVTNGWCTSSRMHEPVKLQCIFGCRHAKDKLEHYLDCHFRWSSIDEVFGKMIDRLPAGRVNFLHPSPDKVIIISCTFEVYHALKIGLRETVVTALTSGDFSEVHRVSHKLIVDKFLTSQGLLTGITPHPNPTDGER